MLKGNLTSVSKKNADDFEKMIIQKSHPMLALWKSPLTLPEFKLLDLYLSRIDSQHPEKRWVRFNKGEIEQLLGVTYLKPNQLKDRLRNLCITVEIPNQNIAGGFDVISLFERAICLPDENGVWQVDLQCTPSAMKYIFNIENIGYIRYKLQAIRSLTSRYTYILFLYLEQNRFRVSWEEDVDTLREILGCTSEFYASYKQFNQHILRRSQTELLKKTECKFDYTPIRIGRRVQRICFLMEKQPPCIGTSSGSEEVETSLDLCEFLRSACCPPGTGQPEFSRAQIAHVLQLIRQVPPDKLPSWTPGGNYEFAMYHYLCERYAAMNRRAEIRFIKNRINYLIAMIRNDANF